MRIFLLISIFAFCACQTPKMPSDKVLYSSEFNAAAAELPDELFLIDGDFSIVKHEDQFVVKLAEFPLGAFGVLFGPEEGLGTTVTAEILGTKRKRRKPRFGLGMTGIDGYKVFIDAKKKKLQLIKGEDEVVREIPFTWESGAWFTFKAQVQKNEANQVEFRAKAWKTGSAEPDWMLKAKYDENFFDGQASIWGNTYSEKPIYFRNLKVVK